MSDSIERPSFGKWIGGLAALATAFIGVLVGCKVITPENLWMWVYGVLALATVGFLVHLLEWKITSRIRVSRSILDEQARALANETKLRLEKESQAAKEEAQRAKVNEELEWRAKQHEIERKIVREIPASETPQQIQARIEQETRARIAVKAKLKEEAEEQKKRQFAWNKYQVLEGLGGEEELRAKSQNPSFSEEVRRSAQITLDALLKAKADSGVALPSTSKTQDFAEVLEMERCNDLEDPLTREAMETIMTIKPKVPKP